MIKNFFYNNIIFFSIIIIIFYIGILIFSDVDEIFNHIFQIDIFYIPIIFSLVVLHLIILGIKYHRILQKLKISIPLKESIKIFLSGISLIATPGGAGTAIKSQILKKKYDVPISKSLPIILIERLTELIANIIILLVFFYWANLFESTYAIVIGTFFLFIMYLLISKNKIFHSLKIFLKKIKKVKNFSDSIDSSKESFQILTKNSVLLEMTGWSLIAKFFQLIAVYFIFISLNIDLGIILSGQIYFTSLILGSLSFLPSGIIVTESTMIAILNNNGITISMATILVIFVRLATTWFATILGIITLKITYK